MLEKLEQNPSPSPKKGEINPIKKLIPSIRKKKKKELV